MNTNRARIDLDQLRARLHYDQLTGAFTWNNFSGRMKHGGNRRHGGPAGSLNNVGYIQIWIDGQSYKAHRLGWFYVHGEWPSGQIDHINGNRADNRIVNLREATHSQNCANSGKTKKNRSGVRGVSWRGDRRRWRARINYQGKKFHLGYFHSIDEAAEHYRQAARQLFGEFANFGAASVEVRSP